VVVVGVVTATVVVVAAVVAGAVVVVLDVVANTDTTSRMISLQVKGVLVAENKIKTSPVFGVTQKPLFGALRVIDPSPLMVQEARCVGLVVVSAKTT